MTKEITAALCKFIQQVGTIEEKSDAQYDKFADLSTVLSVVNPVLAANGLIVTNTTKIVEDKNILSVQLMHISGETLPPSEILLPKGIAKNELYSTGQALTYFKRYLLLGLLNLTAGIPDHDGQVYNPDIQEDKVTPLNKNKAVGMPTILDDETKQYYLQIVGKLLVKDKKLYNTLADALYIEFDFDRNKKLSENITKPSHVTFIEEWLAVNTWLMNHLKLDLLMLLHQIGKIVFLYPLNSHMLITRNLEIGVRLITTLTHQVLIIWSQTIYQKTMFNSTITGNLTGDAEYAQVGAYDVAKFTIAVNHNKEDVTYVSCTVFGKAWQSIVDSFKKGLKVTVHGRVTGIYNYMTKEEMPASKVNFAVTDFDYPHNIKARVEETATIPF